MKQYRIKVEIDIPANFYDTGVLKELISVDESEYNGIFFDDVAVKYQYHPSCITYKDIFVKASILYDGNKDLVNAILVNVLYDMGKFVVKKAAFLVKERRNYNKEKIADTGMVIHFSFKIVNTLIEVKGACTSEKIEQAFKLLQERLREINNIGDHRIICKYNGIENNWFIDIL